MSISESRRLFENKLPLATGFPAIWSYIEGACWNDDRSYDYRNAVPWRKAVSSESQISYRGRIHVAFGDHAKRPERAVTTFDYGGEAELFPPRNHKYPHKRFGYRRFALAADAVRFAIEQLPPELLIGAILEVDGKRFGGEQIHRLYDSDDFPLLRNPASRPVERNREYLSRLAEDG
jgi:hypothetical protein